ncbi:hypothetical protein HYV80_07650 [Candidatus Woesearchaeota archaeon]|nr:hypothetical protein [Candidatus Woesearchaeota archaeon]
MSISIPFDDVVSRLYMSSSRIVNLGNDFLNRLPHLIRPNPGPPSQNDPNQNADSVIKTSWGEELGYLVNMSSFPKRFFSDGEISLIDYSDRRDKEIHKGEGRKMGGVYDSHPLDMVLMHYRIAAEIAPDMVQITGLDLEQILKMFMEPSFVIGTKGHDRVEDHTNLEVPVKEFKAARAKTIQQHGRLMPSAPEYQEMMDWRGTIKRLRAEIVAKEHEMQTAFIEDLGISATEKAGLLLVGDLAMGIMDWSARHIEENFFTASMFYLCQRFSVRDYVEHGRGGPFQAKLMGRLNLTSGKEPMENMSARMHLRLLDRVMQSREIMPRYTKQQAAELETQFGQHKFLRELFGEVAKEPDERGIRFKVDAGFSRPDLLDIVYRNDVVLTNVGYALKNYGKNFARQQKRNPMAYMYLLAILKARDYLIAENDKIIGSTRPGEESGLVKSYKGDLGRRVTAEIEANVASLPPHEFDMVTGEGPITNGFWYETGYRENKENGNEHQLRRNYDDVLRLRRLNGNFRDPQRNIVDLKIGKFDLFVIKGIGKGIHFDITPAPYRGI